jgi:hypothetical protein
MNQNIPLTWVHYETFECFDRVVVVQMVEQICSPAFVVCHKETVSVKNAFEVFAAIERFEL